MLANEPEFQGYECSIVDQATQAVLGKADVVYKAGGAHDRVNVQRGHDTYSFVGTIYFGHRLSVHLNQVEVIQGQRTEKPLIVGTVSLNAAYRVYEFDRSFLNPQQITLSNPEHLLGVTCNRVVR